MDWQALVIEVGHGRLRVRPLDGARSIWLKVPGCDGTHIENELLRLGRPPEGTSGGRAVAIEVLGSSIDPTYIDDRPPQLEPGAEDTHAFAEYVAYDESEPFQSAMELLRAGRSHEARRALRDFVAVHPLHIDSYHHLGNIAWGSGRLTQALKYYEMAYRIGRLTVPAGFSGRLPWGIIENRPFLRAPEAARSTMASYRPRQASRRPA